MMILYFFFLSISNTYSIRLCRDCLYHFGWHTSCDCIFRYIFGHDCAGCNDCAVTNDNTRQDHCIGSDPDISADMDGGRNEILPMCRIQIVIQSGKDYIVTNLRTVSYGDSSLILKFTSGIEEYMFSYCKVFSTVCIKRRKQTECLIYGFTGQLFHKPPDFLRGMIAAI